MVCGGDRKQCIVGFRDRTHVGAGWNAGLCRPDRSYRPERGQHRVRDGVYFLVDEPGLWAGQACAGVGGSDREWDAGAVVREPYWRLGGECVAELSRGCEWAGGWCHE